MVSIILCIYRNPDSMDTFLYRLRNMIECLYSFSSQTYKDLEVIIVEQYIDLPYLEHIFRDTNYKYKAIQHPVFNLPWCMNVGSNISTGDLILPFPVDSVVGPDFIDKLINKFQGGVIFACSELVYLTEEYTIEYINNRDYNMNLGDCRRVIMARRGDGVRGEGAPILSDRNFFFNILGGWNERYFNWGGADCDITVRTRYLKPDWETLDYMALHLNHGGQLPRSGDISAFEIAERFPQEVSLLIEGNCGSLEGPNPIDFESALRSIL